MPTPQPKDGTLQFVWWWRWSSLWPPLRLGAGPYPNHPEPCPARGAIYEWWGWRIGPLEIRKWGRVRGDCTCNYRRRL